MDGRLNADGLSALEGAIAPLDEAAMAAARAHWNSVAKPIGSLGLLEDLVVQMAGLAGTEQVHGGRRAVLVMCADNGVVAEGVTQTGQEVTALVAANMAKGASSVCRMAAVAGADVVPVDIGMAAPAEGVVDRRIAAGTRNMAQGPAMTRAQAASAVRVGIDMVAELAGRGYCMVATGEMGIGNTTTASAVASVLAGMPVKEATGRGAGLSEAGYRRKVDVIARAIAVNRPDPADALDVLSKVGGLDIAGMAGAFIGGAALRIPVVIDGFISAVAAMVAVRLCPPCRSAMMASHVSAEPAARAVLDALGVRPVLHAGMRLGEGTGAVCLFPLIDMALSLYNGLSFSEVGLAPYEVDPQ